MTAQELLGYRNEPYRHELIGGRLHEMEPTGAEHGVVSKRICVLLDAHVQAGALGETFVGDVGFQIGADPDTVRAPDVAFVSQERMSAIGLPTGFWPGPPDLAIEVVSPSDRHSEVLAKALQWLDAGAQVVVVAEPRRRVVTAYRSGTDIRVLGAGDTLDLDDVVCGFAPQVANLFA
ncbi:MAG TPA: Uma2 family endonuclease [Solirubrobacteraceae bacterium]|jgi:Uma2 family endonuclease